MASTTQPTRAASEGHSGLAKLPGLRPSKAATDSATVLDSPQLRRSDPLWQAGQAEPPRKSREFRLSAARSEDSTTPETGRAGVTRERSSTTASSVSLEEESNDTARSSLCPSECPPLRQPIQVQLAARVYYIMDSGTDAWTQAGELLRSFRCRFSLHMKWTDMYYQHPVAGPPDTFQVEKEDDLVHYSNRPEGGEVHKDDLVHYSTHPKVGHKAVPFPDQDLSMHGVKIPMHGLPRWTPEIKFFDAMEEPRVIRCEYSADRATGTVQCFYEATGTFLRNAGKTDTVRLCIGTQHRKKTLIFVPHEMIKHANLTMSSPALNIKRQPTDEVKESPRKMAERAPDTKAPSIKNVAHMLVPLFCIAVGVLAYVLTAGLGFLTLLACASTVIAVLVAEVLFFANAKEEEKPPEKEPELKAVFTVEETSSRKDKSEGTAHFASIKKARNIKCHQATFYVPGGRKPTWNPVSEVWKFARGNPGSTLKYCTSAAPVIRFLQQAYATLLSIDFCQIGMLEGWLFVWGVCEDPGDAER